jgi:protein TonB
MFDLTAEPAKRPLREPFPGLRVAAIVVHATVLLALIAIPVSRVVSVQPETPAIEAFVMTPEMFRQPAAAPPPPAAAPPPAKSEPVPAVERPAAPSEAPVEIQPEHIGPSQSDAEAGLEGGVEAGVSGGVIGGVAGGLGTVPPVAPARRAAPAHSAAPIRVSGAVRSPDLLHRVEPVYSALAAASHISGVVILDAVVDVNGSVESVTLVRSRSPLLDNAAAEALKQWKYAPLVVAGVPTPFAVTVTFNFSIPTAGSTRSPL